MGATAAGDAGFEVHAVRYEDLVVDVEWQTRRLLAFLGLEPPTGHRSVPPHGRQADELNAQGSARYRAEYPADRAVGSPEMRDMSRARGRSRPYVRERFIGPSSRKT